MNQNATVAELTPTQLVVVAALAGGSSIIDAAAAGGVDRSTVHRWLRTNFAFNAAFNRLRNELRAEVEHRLLSSAADAANTVAASVVAGNVAAALALLRGLGLLTGSAPQRSSESAEELQAEYEDARTEAESVRAFRRRYLTG